jgi:hypothetical protein
LSPASRSNCDIRCGVIGISKTPIRHGASASETALSTAAGAPIVPPSPTPLAPVTLAEMSLHVVAYNLKRMIKIFGVGPLMAAITT